MTSYRRRFSGTVVWLAVAPPGDRMRESGREKKLKSQAFPLRMRRNRNSLIRDRKLEKFEKKTNSILNEVTKRVLAFLWPRNATPLLTRHSHMSN